MHYLLDKEDKLNAVTKMTEEVKPEAMKVEEQEEGEILEDGEIADDEDDIVALPQNGDPAPGPNNEKENKEISNQTPFAGTFSSYYVERYILTDNGKTEL